jgi:hypothetical protein
MSDKIVTLAMFHDPLAAEMARNRLTAEGIPAMVTGDTTGGLFGGMGGAFGMVHLQVAENNLARATRILDAMEDDLDDDGDSAGITAKKGGKKRRRQGPERDEEPDEPEEAIQAERPAGERPRKDPPGGEASETAMAASPLPPRPKDDDEDEPRLSVGPDDLASRAWKAAIIGLVLMPFYFVGVPVQIYSVTLLFRLMATPEDLSPRATRSLYVALVANVAAWSLLLFMLFGYRLY